eukprot:scaffold5172_cov150-Isochrysis_galbana.AAC.5
MGSSHSFCGPVSRWSWPRPAGWRGAGAERWELVRGQAHGGIGRHGLAQQFGRVRVALAGPRTVGRSHLAMPCLQALRGSFGQLQLPQPVLCAPDQRVKPGCEGTAGALAGRDERACRSRATARRSTRNRLTLVDAGGSPERGRDGAAGRVDRSAPARVWSGGRRANAPGRQKLPAGGRDAASERASAPRLVCHRLQPAAAVHAQGCRLSSQRRAGRSGRRQPRIRR